MKTEYGYLLHLLGAYLKEEVPKIEENIDWDQLMQLAQTHSVSGILGYMAMKYPICVDAERKAALRSLCLNTIAVFAQRLAAAETMVRELEKAGIDHILMKGYVLRELYPIPELRTFNDIDLVIRPEDRRCCDECMLSLGFHRYTDWEPVYSYVRGKELYEIHTELVDMDLSDQIDFRDYFRKMWEHTDLVGKHSYRFTPEFHFLYLLVHIAKHIHSAGAGIRMYLDVAALIRSHGDTMDWKWIRQQLAELKLEHFAAVVLGAVEDWFGVCAPCLFEKAADGVMEAFLTFTMEAGVFGHQRGDAVNKLKHVDLEEKTSKLRQVVQQSFPPARTIQSRYTYLQERPWLLPVAWAHRLVKNRGKFTHRVHQMQEILDADTEEILQLQKLMRDIGL